MSTQPTTSSSVRLFRTVAVVEAISWLLLIIATIVKYSTDPMQEIGVKILGPVHGVLFVLYVALVLFDVRKRVGWDTRTTVIVLIDSVIPGGGFLAARRRDLAAAAAR